MNQQQTQRSKRLRTLLKFRHLVGSAGVDRHETPYAKKMGSYFNWVMLLIIFWLPFQWHFSLTGILSNRINIILDWMIWFMFVIETVSISYCVNRVGYYLLTNWLNLFIIVTGFPILWNYVHFLATFRILRIILAINIIIPWISQIRSFFTKNHLGIGILVFFVGTILGGILIASVDPGISDPLEGIWWAWQTVTTVGYGDFIPVSWPGRIIGIIVMLMGMGLFSLVTANFSAFLIGKETKKEEKINRKTMKLIKELTGKIERLEKEIQKLNK